MNEQLCVNCLKPVDPTIGGGEICPSCGFNNTTPQFKGALPYFSELQGHYLLGRVKCANSEGLTYSALDKDSGIMVDIREFYPVTLVYRDTENGRVCPAEGNAEVYRRYYAEFEDMAEALLRLGELNGIIPVIAVFRENNTIYFVYEHFDSVSLKNYVENEGGTLTWNKVRELFMPLISSLGTMQSLRIHHLGISPETLRVCRDGKLRLSEFSIESVRRVGGELSPDLVSGCAAYEQYTKNRECGETTDVYGFTACMLYALSGALPQSAAKRAKDQRLLISRELIKRIPQNVISAIANGLQVMQENRTGSFERLRLEISSKPVVEEEIEETRSIRELPNSYKNIPKKRRGLPPKFWLALSFILTACIMTGVVYYIIHYTDLSSKVTGVIDDATAVSSAEVVNVPDMVGDSYNDWLDNLKDTTVYKFTINVSSEEFSDTVADGRIISQEPKGGGTVAKGGVVNIVLSRGSKVRKLPRINGIKFTEAQKLLEDEGFTVVKEESYSKDVASGTVMWYRDYNSYDELEYGTEVVVFVSIGKDPSLASSSSSSSS